MDEIEAKIREYGQKRRQDKLQEYIEKLETRTLVSFVNLKYKTSNFIYVWKYLMQSFTDSSKCHKKRFEVVSSLLNELGKGLLSTSQGNAIITPLCMEMPKFKAEHLIHICSFCMECIQKGTVSEMCWKDVLPEALNAIIKCNHVEYNDQDMTGLEYKTQLVNSLCMLAWSPSIITSLASMFTEMPLTKEEHFQVVNKLGKYMEKLTCHELPAFVYQMLKLCRYQNSRSIFLRLQYYFATRIYSRKDLMLNSDSESTNVDAISDTTNQDTMEVESTIIFYIHQSASAGSECIKDYLSSLKNLVKSPEFILHPFQFTILLAISTVATHEEKVMDILRLCISRSIQEELKKRDSCWFREMISSSCKIEDIIRQVIECSENERHVVVQGLVQLAYVLLGVSPMLGREGDLVCERQWELGKMILLKIIKMKRQIAPHIISSLNNHIVTGQNVLRYIDFINILCEKMSLIMLENQSCVIELMEYLVQIPGPTAGYLFDAILPLTKSSPTIRDHLILLLRKALYSRTVETRQMAVSGFLKLIKELKISNLTALSQSSNSSSMSSGHSLLTQASLSCSGRPPASVFSNEALCLEVLGILRRCFFQQSEVRSQLYDGLYNAVCVNLELGIPVLGMLWWHFNHIYVSDDEAIPPVQFSKITVTKDTDVKLQEPLGKLILTMGLILLKVQDDNDNNSTVIKLKAVLESLCNRMVNCELIHLELDDGTDLLDITPESKHKLLVLMEALCVYEGLIGYKIASWGPMTENAQQINSLFQGYNRLVDFSKNLTKTKKGEKRKNNESKDTDQSHSNATLKENTTSKPFFKKPDTILDLETITKMLSLLHFSEVSWTSAAEANVIKAKREIHQHIMVATFNLIKKLKSLKTRDVRYKKMCFNFLTEIGGILYERCIVRLDSFLDFDGPTASTALESFHLIVKIISSTYENKLALFLSSLTDKSKDEELSNLLQIPIETYQKLFELEEIESSSDAEMKKLQLTILNTITLLSSRGSPTLNTQLLDWLKSVMSKQSISNKQVASGLISLLFNTHLKCKNTTALFENVICRLSAILGTINEEEENSEEFELINEANALTVFPLLCNSVKTLLDDLDWIILRLKAEFEMITYPGEDNPERRKEYLKSKERGLCCQFCSSITILGTMCNIKIPPGNLSETLLKTITHLYNSLNALTKYFMMRSSKINLVFQGARFERVVKLAGKQLSTVVYDYIIYIEGFNKQQTQLSQTKKKSVNADLLKNKVLRETRLIPKVVYEIEQFGKTVIQLSNKTQVDLTKFIGQGSTRDFRIKGLQEVLAQSKAANGHDDTAADVSTESDSVLDTSVREGPSEEDSPTVSKRKRRN